MIIPEIRQNHEVERMINEYKFLLINGNESRIAFVRIGNESVKTDDLPLKGLVLKGC